MRRFAALFEALDEGPRGEREGALVAYFRDAPPADAAWALSWLTGGQPRRAVSPPQLRQWAAEAATVPTWLVEESERAVGDLAEAVALLLEGVPGLHREWPLHELARERLLPLSAAGPAPKRELLLATWRELPAAQYLAWNKLIIGTFRPRLTVETVAHALATATGCDAAAVVERVEAGWEPSAEAMRLLLAPRPAPRATGHPPLENEFPVGAAAAASPESAPLLAPEAAPLLLDAVLLYAQRGEGRRSTHYADYTFAVWHEGELVPVAKTGTGLGEAEVEELDRWVRRNIVERFGPVRQVRPELVFELAFEAVSESRRHKAGLALQAPRVLRWRRERRAEEAGTLEALRRLLVAVPPSR